MTIATSAVLVELNLSVWAASIADKASSETVISDNCASRDAASVKKNLMAGTSRRKQIAEIAAAARNYHHMHTLPWSDRGPRLLPSSLFFDYKEEIDGFKSRFETAAANFVRDYDSLVATSQTALGSLFCAADYPPVERVKEKFGFRLVFSPVPEAGDFRLEVGQLELEELKQQYDEAFADRLAEAVHEPWERMHTMLCSMVEKLSVKEGKQRWHDSFLGNAYELCSMLKHLNVTGDVKLNEAGAQLRAALQGSSVDALKVDEGSRRELKKGLESVLKGYAW